MLSVHACDAMRCDAMRCAIFTPHSQAMEAKSTHPLASAIVSIHCGCIAEYEGTLPEVGCHAHDAHDAHEDNDDNILLLIMIRCEVDVKLC